MWDVNVPVDMKAPGMRVYDRVMDDDNRWSFKRIDSAILFREYMREQKREVGEGGVEEVEVGWICKHLGCIGEGGRVSQANK